MDLTSIEVPQHDETVGSIAAQHLALDFVAQDDAARSALSERSRR